MEAPLVFFSQRWLEVWVCFFAGGARQPEVVAGPAKRSQRATGHWTAGGTHREDTFTARETRMANSTLELVGFLAGTAALSYATFVAVSFVEVQKKVQAGLDDPLKYYPKQKTPPKQKAKPVAPAPPKKAKDRKSGKGCVDLRLDWNVESRSGSRRRTPSRCKLTHMCAT